jgi:hypothetical protein
VCFVQQTSEIDVMKVKSWTKEEGAERRRQVILIFIVMIFYHFEPKYSKFAKNMISAIKKLIYSSPTRRTKNI